MKKLLSFVATIVVFLPTLAQQAPQLPTQVQLANYNKVATILNTRFESATHTAHKTTAASRWYSYCDYFAQQQVALGSSVAYSFPYLWKNNKVLMVYPGPAVDTNSLVSYGMVLDPTICPGFNDSVYYPGAMRINSTDSFTVDSISFTGIYEVNPAQTSIDTIRVSFVFGDGAASQDIFEVSSTISASTPLANYGFIGSVLKHWQMNAKIDTIRLTPDGTTLHTYDILLNNAISPPSWAADTIGGLYVKSIPIGINIPSSTPGNLVGATVSFISGATVPLWDTVYRGSAAAAPVKYNMFRPGIVHRGTATSVLFPPYLATNRNNGVFIDSPTSGLYVPQWYWTAGPVTVASPLQYPAIFFKLSCASCGIVNTHCPGVSIENTADNVICQALPNPTDNELNISFQTGSLADVQITISNMLGQTVATKNMGITTHGTATFHTAHLPAGLYVYNVIINDTSNVGRVLIVH